MKYSKKIIFGIKVQRYYALKYFVTEDIATGVVKPQNGMQKILSENRMPDGLPWVVAREGAQWLHSRTEVLFRSTIVIE